MRTAGFAALPMLIPPNPVAAPGGTLTTLTVSEATGSTQTNVPVTFGLPLAAGSLASGQSISVVDSDGTTALLTQEDNRASDLTPNLRYTTVSFILPTLTANQNRQLTVKTISGTPASGTDISIADVVAAATNSLNALISIVDTSGNTFTADPMTAFNSGNNGWVNITTATVMGKWTGGGGLRTGYILHVPLVHSGTPHASLYARFDCEFFKAARGAVSGGNPILACFADAVICSGVVQGSGATVADNWYSLSVGPSGQFASFPTTSPTQTITLSANTAGSVVTATANSALFSINSIGQMLADGTGFGPITGFTDSTHVKVGIFKAFSGTSLTSGNYKLYGINHPYAARLRTRCRWSPSGTPSDVSVQGGTVYLGNAWNNGAQTGGPFSYIRGTGFILNYQTTAATVASYLPTVATVPQSSGQGNNPSGYLTETANIGGEFDGFCGNWQMRLEATGEGQQIGPNPDLYIGKLIQYDSVATGAIFQEADKWNLSPQNLIDNNTGVVPLFNNGTDWAYLASHGTAMNFPATNSIQAWSDFPQFGHGPEPFFIPYFITGDWYWLDSFQNWIFANWCAPNPSFVGSQMNRLFINGGNGNRSDAWGIRSNARFAMMLPDTSSSVLGLQKSGAAGMKTYLENQYTAINSGVAGSFPQPGTNIQFVNNTNYVTPNGIRWTGLGNNDQLQFSGYQLSYFMTAMASVYEIGMLSANGIAFWAWLAEGQIAAINDTTDVTPIYTAIAYWIDAVAAGTSTPLIYTWSAAYKAFALNPGSFSPQRTPTGTMTLSGTHGTPGSPITATIPTGYLGGGSFYVGGWVQTSDGGQAKILSVPSATTLHLDTTASVNYYNDPSFNVAGHDFGATSYLNASSIYPNPVWQIPIAAPGDSVGQEFAYIITGLNSGEYLQLSQASHILLNEYQSALGISGEPAAMNTVLGWTGGMVQSYPIKWNVAGR